MSAKTSDRFRPTQQVHARLFDGELIVVHLGEGKYFSLDEVGAFVWEQLGQGRSIDDVAEAIVARYEIDQQTALRDAMRLARELVENKLIEPVRG